MASLQYGAYYHIYNRGINGCKVFRQQKDFLYFLQLYKIYIPLIAETLAWVLMKNHFHFLVRIKEEDSIGYIKRTGSKKKTVKWAPKFRVGGAQDVKKPNPSNQFSHLFNAYAKWFNKKYERTGSLFEKGFKRKLVENEEYLIRLIYYIHHNPIHHGATENYSDYKWSSFGEFLDGNPSIASQSVVEEWFGGLDNFVFYHMEEHLLSLEEDYLMD